MKVLMLSILGYILLIIGAIGLLLPVWPTTPFVLAGAACLSGNPKLRAKIMSVRFFREYINNYSQRNGLTRKTVILSLLFLWGMLLFSAILIRTWWIVLLLGAVGAAVTIHIIYIATPKDSN